MVSLGNRVADIGCDHGYVSIYLVESGKTPRVIAMDVNAGPLERAKVHIEEHQLAPFIEIRLSDGTQKLQTGEADSLICAGMGGRLIIRILTEGMEKITLMKELVLQPQSEIHLVRSFLPTVGYEIVEENMVYEEGKYYPIMRAVPREKATGQDLVKCLPGEKADINNMDGLAEIFHIYGKLLIQENHPVLREYLRYQLEKTDKLIYDLTNNKAHTEKQKIRLSQLQKEREMIQSTRTLMDREADREVC